jgi:hypothetical protein
LLNAPKVEIVSKKDKSERIAMLREQAQARKLAKQLNKEMEQSDSEDEQAGADESEEEDLFKPAKTDRDLSEPKAEDGGQMPTLSRN